MLKNEPFSEYNYLVFNIFLRQSHAFFFLWYWTIEIDLVVICFLFWLIFKVISRSIRAKLFLKMGFFWVKLLVF